MTHNSRKLSVNINKIATLRNARGGNVPDLVQAAVDIQAFGADGITVHPRPDERHIKRSDLAPLRRVVHTEFNMEGYPSEEFIDLVLSICPEQATLVPDPPEALTSNAGWDCSAHLVFLRGVIERLKTKGIRTSIFLEANDDAVKAAAQTGTDRIELYTESYAVLFGTDRESAVAPFRSAAEEAIRQGLGLNAGHDLALKNLRWFSQQVPGLLEVSIGHALICDALYFGLENAVRMYKRELVGDEAFY